MRCCSWQIAIKIPNRHLRTITLASCFRKATVFAAHITMRVLILGATGPSGIELVKQSLAAGHTVVLYVRSPKKVPPEFASHSSVIVVQGQLSDAEAILKAMDGVNAVISALGPPVLQGITYPGNTPLAHGFAVLLDAMKKRDIKRIILLGTASITDENDKFSAKFSALVHGVAIFAHNAYKDVVAIGETVRAEPLDVLWTIARVPILTSDKKTDVIAGYIGDGKTHTTLSRAAFANFVVSELENNEWCRKAPLVSSP